MKAVIQVVGNASLKVDSKTISEINKGLVVYFCVEKGDDEEKLDYFAKKIANLRIFLDENGKTNLSVLDVKGEILFVSQFTLAGDCQHGNRPSFVNAEVPERANDLYLKCANILSNIWKIPTKIGVFGADMTINQQNLGPFTLFLEK